MCIHEGAVGITGKEGGVDEVGEDRDCWEGVGGGRGV